jgi:hypothetical protein
MVRIQLSTGYLDVKEGTSFPLNFSIGDIRDISKRTGSFSKTITLIGNSNNNTLLNHYYDVNIQAGTFNINTITNCDVLQNGIPVMINATLQLINIKKTQVTGAYEQMIEYEVLIKENRGAFFSDISNKYLTDLDFSYLDHYVDSNVIIDSFNNTIADSYKYVMPFNIDNQYQQNWFNPAIYAELYFDRIFAAAGYSYTWDGLADANFDKLLIPYNGDQNIVDWTDYQVVAEKAAFNELETQTILSTANWDGITQLPMEARDLTTGWSETLDAQNLFNTTNGQYTTPQSVGLGSGESYIYEVTMAGELSLNFNTSVRLYPDGTAAYRVFLLVKVGINPNVKCYLPDLIYNDDVNYFATPTVTSLGTFNHIFTFNATTNSSGVSGQGGIDVGDIQIMQIGVDVVNTFSVSGDVYNNLVYWQPQTGTTPQTPNIDLDITSFDVTIRPSDNIPLNSGVTTMNTFIPDKIKQSDFIKSIFLMYNLYVTEDPNSETNLILLHRDEYYDSGKAVDWTNLLMKDKEQSLVFIPELNNKKLRLSHKADIDSPNKVYTDVTTEIYGQVEVTFENEYVKGIDVKETIFSPTPVQRTIFNAFLPLLNGAAPKTNLRILFDNGEITAQNVDIISGYDTVTPTNGAYPYISHFGGADPLNPTFDINFAECQYYYYQVAQNTNNNLYNKYWRRTVAQINGGKLLTAYFYLRENDIQLMELNDKIRINNSWWSINKVIDYNANNLQPTKVELISLETEIDLPTFFSGSITPVGPGDGSQVNSIMQQYNNSTNVTTNNHNSIILGSGNVVGDGLRALVVGDGLTVENDGIATTNLTVTGTLNNRSVSDILPTYTKYVALITQSGTNDPTVVELENTIGPIVWTRISTGVYEGTLTGVFTLDKVYTTLNQVYTNSIALVYRKDIDAIKIETTNLHSPTAAHHDTHLLKNTLEIRVYE